MQSLKQGSTGPDVEAWQNFLVGQGSYWLDVDGDFTHDTIEGTKDFQKSQGLDQDGEVGPGTLKAAIAVGFPDPDAAAATGEDVLGPSWPPKPSFPSLGFMERAKIFGTFAFEPAPVPGNPEAIRITDGWDKHNIVTVDIPQLHGTKGCPNGKVSFHRKGATQLQNLFKAWETAGLLPLIKTFDGGWNPRFVRGSTKYLSNHAYGTAFDLNAQQNPLGSIGALVGKEGSTRKLVDIALEYGVYWGGWFKRRDPMHFECCKLVD